MARQKRPQRPMTQELVRELFDYQPGGYLTWKVKSTNGKMKPNDVAGNLNKSTSYYHVKVDRKVYQLHRLIFLWHHGYFPEQEVDHRDRNKGNNNIWNLRAISTQCNARNRKLSKNNKTGVTGVAYLKNANRYRAAIKVDGKFIYLGVYKEFDDAVKARYDAEVKYGFHSCIIDSTSMLHLKSRNLLP